MPSIGFVVISVALILFSKSTNCAVVQLTNDNFDTIVSQNEVVFINFYADWCHFSQILAPIFEEASTKVAEEFPNPGTAVLGKVDCDRHTALASRFHITKYPTLKLVINGQVGKKEFRGQRSVEAIVKFVQEQLRDPVKEVKTAKDIDDVDLKSRAVFGFFESKESPKYETFLKTAKNFKDHCEFYVAVGPGTESWRPNGDTVVFRPAHFKYGSRNLRYMGDLMDFNQFNTWTNDNCIPIVREITFENAEELTEEGLPFLILFHEPDDHDIVNKFTSIVKTNLGDEKGTIVCLTADGLKFSHPLHHLGKSKKDLPLIAIDSFRHMYLFPNIKEMTVPGKLKQFITDLHSGKLHREFHYGPDPVTQNEVAHHPDANKVQGQATDPPESTFKRLAPSRSRYTILRDEL